MPELQSVIESKAIDPITREIVQNALSSAADQMSLTLYRTAYSTIVRDCLDYSTSLCNAEGEMIAQGVTIPMHLGSVPYAMKALFNKFTGCIEPEDVFIMNDPFDGGMHIPDIFVVKPIFWKSHLVAWAATTAHHHDLGGRVPGSSACDNTEIFQDGFRMPWLKLYDRGVANEAIFELLRSNVRVPRTTLGDIRAQLSACHIGENAIHEIISRYGETTFRDCCMDLLEYTEALVRSAIKSWPDGSYSFTDYMDSDGVGGPPVKISVNLTVHGDSLTVDFSGSSRQVRGAINSTYSFACAAAAMCIRSVLREEIPNTAGMFRPLTVIAPVGLVVNAKMPAASSMRGVTGFRMVDTIFGALAKMLPDRVLAAGEGSNSLVIIGGQENTATTHGPYVFYELVSGTWGGRPDRDGIDGMCNPANIVSNVPVEQAECEYPVRIERYGFVTDSGGAGRFRGGMGIEREWSLLTGEAHLGIRSDRRDHLPYGLLGGKPGKGSISILTHPDGTSEVLSTMISTSMKAGDRLYHRQAGGGGHGNPCLRDPDAVSRDVKNDRVSLNAAREEYGVVINSDSSSVNIEATQALRALSRDGECQ